MSQMFISTFPTTLSAFLEYARENDFTSVTPDGPLIHPDGDTVEYVHRGNRVILTVRGNNDPGALLENMVGEYDDEFDHYVRLMRRAEMRRDKNN